MNSVDDADRKLSAFVLGVAAGTVTSLVAAAAYIVAPLTTGEHLHDRNTLGLEATYTVLEHFAHQTPLVHAVVLLGTPFLTTMIVFLYARRQGLVNLTTDALIASGILAMPIVTIWSAMIVAVVAIGATAGLGIMLFAISFGIPITILLTVVVVSTNVVGTAGGYALVRGLERADVV